VDRCRARVVIVVAFAATLLIAPAASASPSPQAHQTSVLADIGGAPVGQRMPLGFVGVSVEYGALYTYAGRNPDALDPVLLALLRQLAPGQAPVLRIGGDSADATWWPVRGAIAPGGVDYRLTPGWLATARALARTLGARLVMGINLAGDRPALAAAEARAVLAGIGRRYIEALEIGNEPDLYGGLAWYVDLQGQTFQARRPGYDLADFTRDISRWRAALPRVPLAGPALSGPGWMSGLGSFLAAEPGLGVVTYHRYPMIACVSDPTSPAYPSIANMLADSSTTGLAEPVASYVALAHARGLPFRIGELNSAACEGRAGVSDTFASALWVLDALFAFASVGVDGVNVHTLPGAAYELFTITHTRSGWQAFVHPEYYGMLMFAQAFPAGAQLLPVSAPSGPVKIWATRDSDSVVRVVLINMDTTADHTVVVQMPASAPAATLEWLKAPSAAATTGVTLGGQTFGEQTRTGSLAGPSTTAAVTPAQGGYSIDLPAASATLLTQSTSGSGGVAPGPSAGAAR